VNPVAAPAPVLAVEPLSALPVGLHMLRSALIVLSLTATSVALHLVVVSSLEHRSAQQRSYSSFRRTVAEGTAPTGPTDASGRLLRNGTPVAFLEIPAIGVKEVVGEGTAGADLMAGPGHRRDSPFPGQAGTSVVLGRQAAYGGPFNRLADLSPGAKITVTTGQGVSTFTVTALRHGGEPAPPALRSGQGRLLLVSAAGAAYVPSGVLRVDADLDSPALPAPPATLWAASLPHQERIMATDASTLWRLALWLQALIAVTAGIVWSWHRWGRPQTWVVFFPLTTLVGLSTSAEALRLLPNLL
jgi:sortase A